MGVKPNPDRRRFMAAGAVAAGGLASPALAAAPARLRGLAADAGRITIRSVETFDVLVPQPPGADRPPAFGGGTPGRINVTRVETTSGARGYSFLGTSPEQARQARGVLVGEDLFASNSTLAGG